MPVPLSQVSDLLRRLHEMCRVMYICTVCASLASGLAVTPLTSVDTSPDGATICSNLHCGKVSYKEILATYRGIFHTYDDTYKLLQLHDQNRQRDFEKQKMADVNAVLSRPGDGDACCATEFRYYTNQTMVNIHGQTRIIIHMMDAVPPSYQHIPHGSCVQYGRCGGRCFLEPILLNLLVYDPSGTSWLPLMFDWFEVPGYCSCKNVGTAANELYSLTNDATV